VDFETATELADTLAHASDPHSRADRGVESTQALFGDAFAVVSHLKLELVGVASKPDACGRGSRMAMDVRQAFLQDAKQDEFTVSRRPLHLFRDVAVDLDPAAAGESLDEPTGSRSNAGFVEQGWMK
jgi:hypothetical protein